MTSPRHPLEAVGQAVAEVEDRLLSRGERLAEVKRSIPFYPAAYPGKLRSRRLRRGIGFAAAAAAALTLVIIGMSDDLTVESGNRLLEEGEWLSSVKTPTTLRFSDGSRFVLASESGIRVSEVRSDGARLLLERGEVKADVVHTRDAQWQLDVGPYLVTVTGTRLTVGWNPETEVFNLDMTEGSVRVRGPMITEGMTVRGKERIRASLRDRRLALFDGPAPDLSVAPDEPETRPPSHPADPAPAEPIDEETVSRPEGGRFADQRRDSRSDERHLSWHSLAEQGRYREALWAARRQGLTQLTARGTASELLLLGDAARHSGELPLAAKLYRKIRKRFPGSAQASSAAFALGIMAFDKQGDYRRAASWFRVVGTERSDREGLVREATGRLMEALHRTGDNAGARRVAKEYLARYPHGPHAPLANRLTQ